MSAFSRLSFQSGLKAKLNNWKKQEVSADGNVSLMEGIDVERDCFDDRILRNGSTNRQSVWKWKCLTILFICTTVIFYAKSSCTVCNDELLQVAPMTELGK
jgi:hypothetical protein